MASTGKRLRHLGHLFKTGHYREISRLIKRHLGKQPPQQQSPEKTGPAFLSHKEAAVASLLDFYDGGPQPAWPLELFLEVSNVCDLQCAMCPTFSALSSERFTSISNRYRGFFDMDLIEERLDESLRHALVVHAFGYGEPTLHPGFTELLQRLGRYEVMVDFFTHGMHLDEELCAEMVRQRVSKITLSFSGASQEDYENVYLGGNFEQVLSNLKRLHRHKQAASAKFPLIVVNSLAFRHHVEQLPEFVRIMGEAGVNVIHLKPLQTFDKIKELRGHASVYDPDRQHEILEEAQRVARQYGITLGTLEYEGTANRPEAHSAPRQKETIVPITELKAVADRKRHQKGALGKKAEEKIGVQIPSPEKVEYIEGSNIYCTEPFKTLYLSYEGAAYPCCFKNIKSMWGDLNHHTAAQIWQSKLMESLRSNVMNQHYPIKLCGNCMKTHAYPKRNPARMHAVHYNHWLDDKYGRNLSRDLMQRVEAMPEWNDALFEKLQTAQE